MRAFHAIGAALLMAWAIPASSHAAVITDTSAVSPPPAADCNYPGLQHRHAWRPHRHARFHARYWRHGRPAPIAVATPPAYYNVPIPSPYDSAYSRRMTPPSRFYWLGAGGAVFEYDLMAGAYIRLAQSDAQRVLAVAALPR